MTEKEIYIEKFGLIPHPEGGFFREVYRSGATPMESKGNTDLKGVTFNFNGRGLRNILTSIYWMLTNSSPVGKWIKNKSDHIHYHHAGATVTYFVIDQNGKLTIHQLGKNVLNGDSMQLIVKGGCWKASTIFNADFALIGEAVAPGFDSKDFEMATIEYFKEHYPEIMEKYPQLIDPKPGSAFESFY